METEHLNSKLLGFTETLIFTILRLCSVLIALCQSQCALLTHPSSQPRRRRCGRQEILCASKSAF